MNSMEIKMTEHLPECRLTHRCHGLTGVEGKHTMKMDYCEACCRPCICDALQACEQRVIAEGDEQSQIAYSTGYRHALDAAVHAVLALPTDLALSSQYTVLNRAEVFWAIWELKDNP